MSIRIGERVTFTRPDGTTREGRVSALRDSHSVVETDDGAFRGFQVEIDGEEWTPTFADPDRPLHRITKRVFTNR